MCLFYPHVTFTVFELRLSNNPGHFEAFKCASSCREFIYLLLKASASVYVVFKNDYAFILGGGNKFRHQKRYRKTLEAYSNVSS